MTRRILFPSNCRYLNGASSLKTLGRSPKRWFNNQRHDDLWQARPAVDLKKSTRLNLGMANEETIPEAYYLCLER